MRRIGSAAVHARSLALKYGFRHRRLRRGAVLILVTALVAHLTVISSRQEPDLGAVRPSSALNPQRVGDQALDAVPAKIEAEARDALVALHDLEPGDARVNGAWVDDEVRGLMLARLLNTIGTPEDELSELDKQYYRWFQHIVRDMNVKAAEGAIEEYNTWKYHRCNYTPPSDPPYDRGRGCAQSATASGPITASDARQPKVDEFRKWGVARAAVKVGLPDLTGGDAASLLLWAKAAGGGLAVASGAAAAAFLAGGYATTNVKAAFNAARGLFFLKMAGSAAPFFTAAVAAGVILTVVAAIITAVLFVIVLVEEGELPRRLQENLDKSRALPDLRRDYSTAEGAQMLLALFLMQFPPPRSVEGKIEVVDPGSSPTASDRPDLFPPRFTGSGFEAQLVDGTGRPADEPVFAESQVVKLVGGGGTRIYFDRGWVVKKMGNRFTPALSLDYLDWNGHPRRALIRQGKWLDGELPKEPKDLGSLPTCTKAEECPPVDSLRMLNEEGDRITLKTRVNRQPPPVTISAPAIDGKGGATLLEGGTLKLVAEGIKEHRDADGDPITYRWSIEGGCDVTPEYLDRLQSSDLAVTIENMCWSIGPPGSGFSGPVTTREGNSVDVTWADSGTRLVKLEASDGRGASSVAYRSFVIDNVAPTIRIASSDLENEKVAITGCIDDPGGRYEFPGLTVDWGDGTVVRGPASGVRLKPGTTTSTSRISSVNGFRQVELLSLERVDPGMRVSFDRISGCTGTYSFRLTHTYAKNAAPPDGSETFPVTITTDDGDGGGDSEVLRARGVSPVEVTISNLKVLVDTKEAVFRVRFSDPVKGFDASDLILTGATGLGQARVVHLEQNDDGVTMAGVAIPMKSDGVLTLSIPAGAAKAGRRPTAASRPASTGSDTMTVDLTKPTVRIASPMGGVTREREATFTLEFSETVVGLALEDLELSGTATRQPASLIGSRPGQRYVLTVPVTSDGTVGVTLRGARVRDLAGNLADGAMAGEVRIDHSPPTATLSQADGQVDPTAGASVEFAVEFSEPVEGLEANEFALSGTAQTGAPRLSGGPVSYRLLVPVTSDGTVDAALPAGAASDGTGNLSGPAVSVDRSVTVDRTAPGVLVGKADGQADPTEDGDVRFRVIFSEPVSGFDVSDISLSGTASHGEPLLTASGMSHADVEYAVTVPVSSGGTVTLSVPDGAVRDAAGNTSVGQFAEGATVRVKLPPKLVVQVHDKARDYGAADPRFTVTYSGFVDGDGPEVLTGTRTCSTTADRMSPVGTYPISCPGITADEYEIVHISGTLRVDKAPTTLQVSSLVASAPNARARLTMGADAQPAAGYRVSFRSGSSQLCSAMTNADGIATCGPPIGGLVAAFAQGVTARFDGTSNLKPSSGRAGVS